MKRLLGLHLLLWSFTAWAGPASTANLNSEKVILEGYDAVSYFKSEAPQKGNASFQASHDGATYWFTNDANREEFLKNPKKYEPQFGGWCAYAVADSKSKVPVDPKSFSIQDGRLLLFYNGFWGDTRKKWLHTKGKDEKTFLREADANWPETKGTSP